MTNTLWAEATLTLIVACTAVWFSLLSVGFERYSFLAVMLSMLLIGKTAYDGLTRVAGRSSQRLLAGAAAVLTVGVLALNGVGIVRSLQSENTIQQAVDFIQQVVARNALVESLELELTSVAPRRQYHRANYEVIYEAIQQRAHEQQPFDLNYNMLQANPDFLIIGAMGDWLQIYDPAEVEEHFHLLATFGTYRIYQRIRNNSEG